MFPVPCAPGLFVSIDFDRALDSIKETAEDFLRVRLAQFLFGEHLKVRSPDRFEFIVKNIAVQNVGSPHIQVARNENTPSVCGRRAAFFRRVFTKFQTARNAGSLQYCPSRLRVYAQVGEAATVDGINFRAFVKPSGFFRWGQKIPAFAGGCIARCRTGSLRYRICSYPEDLSALRGSAAGESGFSQLIRR